MAISFKFIRPGEIGLITIDETGRIMQIGVTEEQHDAIQHFLSIISENSPLVQMGEDHDLVLKSSLKKP